MNGKSKNKTKEMWGMGPRNGEAAWRIVQCFNGLVLLPEL